jgi:phosphoribosylanthranilate isomerase
VNPSHTDDVESLRRRAERALRLAGGINDERTAQALRAHAADLFDQIKIVEQQQSQKSAPKDVD